MLTVCFGVDQGVGFRAIVVMRAHRVIGSPRIPITRAFMRTCPGCFHVKPTEHSKLDPETRNILIQTSKQPSLFLSGGLVSQIESRVQTTHMESRLSCKRRRKHPRDPKEETSSPVSLLAERVVCLAVASGPISHARQIR